jgi:F-type H+-transporting ATPase subunit b
VAQASTTADQITSAAELRAQEVYDRIVASADAEVSVARQAAVDEVSNRVGEIVLATAERVIGREVQIDDNRDLIDEAIAAVRDIGTPVADAAGGAAR